MNAFTRLFCKSFTGSCPLGKVYRLAEIDHAFTPLNSRVDLKIKILVLHGNAGETDQDGLLASQLQWQHAILESYY